MSRHLLLLVTVDSLFFQRENSIVNEKLYLMQTNSHFLSPPVKQKTLTILFVFSPLFIIRNGLIARAVPRHSSQEVVDTISTNSRCLATKNISVFPVYFFKKGDLITDIFSNRTNIFFFFYFYMLMSVTRSDR